MNPNTISRIRNILTQFVDMPEEQFDALIKISKKNAFCKGEYFSTPEKPSTQLGFITKGLLRHYVIDRKGIERTLAFVCENMPISSYGAVLNNKQDIKYVQAIEEAEIYTIERSDFINLWESSEVWKIFMQKVTEMDNLVIRKRESDFLLYDAKARYQLFLEDFPQLRNRIKQEYIASYLGISPETLSRIKRDK